MTYPSAQPWNPTPSRIPWDLRRLMADRIHVQRQTGLDAYGKPTYGTAINIRCRIDHRNREIRTTTGDSRTSDAMIITDAYYGLNPNDLLLLPTGQILNILAVDMFSDEHGPLYESIFTGSKPS